MTDSSVAEYTGLFQGLKLLQHPIIQHFLKEMDDCPHVYHLPWKKCIIPHVEIQVLGDAKSVIDQINIAPVKIKNPNLQRLRASYLDIIRLILFNSDGLYLIHFTILSSNHS